MARMMIGKDLPVPQHGAPVEGGEVRLRLAGLSHASDDPFGTDLKDIHLDVHSGEIVGIAGVSGNGQQELLYAMSGEEPLAEKFPVQILGTEAGRMRPGRRRRLGMGFVPEERLGRGAVPRMTLAENALLTAHRRNLVKQGLIDFAAVDVFAFECIAQVRREVRRRRRRRRSRSPAATCRSSSWAARSCSSRSSSSSRSRRGAWTSAPRRSSGRR